MRRRLICDLGQRPLVNQIRALPRVILIGRLSGPVAYHLADMRRGSAVGSHLAAPLAAFAWLHLMLDADQLRLILYTP
jgi:hypothetical protein